MELLLLCLALVAFCVFGMCFNIIFRKKEFPQYEVGSNEQMRKMGIRCMHEIEDEMWGGEKASKKLDSCNGEVSEACKGCGLYDKHKQK